MDELTHMKSAMDMVFNAMLKPSGIRIRSLKEKLEDDISEYIVKNFQKNDTLSIEDMMNVVLEQGDLKDKIVDRVVDHVSPMVIEKIVKTEWSKQ